MLSATDIVNNAIHAADFRSQAPTRLYIGHALWSMYTGQTGVDPQIRFLGDLRVLLISNDPTHLEVI